MAYLDQKTERNREHRLACLQEATKVLLSGRTIYTSGSSLAPRPVPKIDGDEVVKLALEFFEFVSADDPDDEEGGEGQLSGQSPPDPGAGLVDTSDPYGTLAKG
jgi:hypothetical protein